MQYEGKVTRQGQITLPKRIRKRYSIREGDRVTYVDLGDHIIVLPKTRNAIKTLLSLKIKTRDSVQKIKQKIYITGPVASFGAQAGTAAIRDN